MNNFLHILIKKKSNNYNSINILNGKVKEYNFVIKTYFMIKLNNYKTMKKITLFIFLYLIL
jgi:hypothetical protein